MRITHRFKSKLFNHKQHALDVKNQSCGDFQVFRYTSIAIGIGVAIFVSVSSIEVGTGTPVAVLVASFLASLIPSTALAANNEDCEAKIQCPKVNFI